MVSIDRRAFLLTALAATACGFKEKPTPLPPSQEAPLGKPITPVFRIKKAEDLVVLPENGTALIGEDSRIAIRHVVGDPRIDFAYSSVALRRLSTHLGFPGPITFEMRSDDVKGDMGQYNEQTCAVLARLSYGESTRYIPQSQRMQMTTENIVQKWNDNLSAIFIGTVVEISDTLRLDPGKGCTIDQKRLSEHALQVKTAELMTFIPSPIWISMSDKAQLVLP